MNLSSSAAFPKYFVNALASLSRSGRTPPSRSGLHVRDWEAVDVGDLSFSPGIRDRTNITKAYGERKPPLDYDPDCDQLKCFDELAHIVEAGEVVRRD